MKYTSEFKKLININTDQFIGLGNPSAKVLIVGKEAATDTESKKPLEIHNTISYQRNLQYWKDNISFNTTQEDIPLWIFNENSNFKELSNNPLYAFKGSIKKHTSNTWKKYQKLHDIIFEGNIVTNNELQLNFQENFFITEMSDFPHKTTREATKKKYFKKELENRKNNYFTSDFIQNFQVIVLACSNYIWNTKTDRQIDRIFGVNFDQHKKFSEGEYVFSKTNKFYTHYDESGSKLVIHTRQLSMNVMDEMIKTMGELIRNHLNLD